jgi:glucose-6-phosphate 1-epimerase
MDNISSTSTIVHSTTGATIKIHQYGATVISYMVNGREQLFLSKDAVLNGSKPIRGGIPLVFPIFGPPSFEKDSTMPQRGFARRSIWTIIKEYDEKDTAGIVLELDCSNINKNLKIIPSDGVGVNNGWYDGSYTNCILQYTVSFNEKSMSNTLSIFNKDTKVVIPFQALLHTYYRIDNSKALDNSVCYVKGLLDNYILVEDKVNTSNVGKTEPKSNVLTISSEVDQVYSPKEIKEDTMLTIGVGEDSSIKVQCTGTICPITCDNTDSIETNSPSICYVVWNPYIDKAKGMSDFSDDEYADMICIEPGLLHSSSNTMALLEPNHVATLTQTMYV